jgi:protein involved in polysaccharide export with SLBB domain
MAFDPFAHRRAHSTRAAQARRSSPAGGLSLGAPCVRNGKWDGMAARETLQARDQGPATMRMALILAISLAVLVFVAAGAQAAQGGGRVLTTSDVVAIRIVDHPDLDWTTRIEPDGTINFPYVGRIKAAGLTQDDLARMIEKRLVELKIIAAP